MEEKLQWAFALYDINGDGVITKDEFTEIAAAIYDMMGKCTDPAIDENSVQEHVNDLYRVSGNFLARVCNCLSMISNDEYAANDKFLTS